MASISDVTVKITIDDAEYVSKLQKVETKTKNTANNIKTDMDNAGNSMSKLGDKAKAAGDQAASSFGRLKDVIGGIGLGAAASDAANYANTIKGLAAASGLSVAEVQGWRKAITAAGGDADNSGDALVDLTQKMNEARTAGGGLLSSFNAVGVSLTDLQTKSSSDISTQVVQGLAAMEDQTYASRQAMVLMGEDVKRVDWDVAASKIDTYTEQAKGSEGAINDAAKAQRELAVAFDVFRQAVTEALNPIAKFIGDNSTLIATAIKVAVSLGTLKGAFSLLNGVIFPLTRFFYGVTTSLAFFTANLVAGKGVTAAYSSALLQLSANNAGPLSGFIQGAISNFKALHYHLKDAIPSSVKACITGFSQLALAIKSLAFGEVIVGLQGIGKGFTMLLAGLSTAAIAFTEILAVVWVVIEGIKLLNEVLKAVFGVDVIESASNFGQELLKTFGFIEQTSRETKALAEAQEAQKQKQEAAAESAKKFAKVLYDFKQAMKDINVQAQLNNEQTVNDINLQTSLIGVGEKRKAIAEAVNQTDKSRIATLDQLHAKLLENMDAETGLVAPELVQEYNAAVDKTVKLFDEQKQAIIEATNAQVELTQSQRIYEFGMTSLYASEAKLRDLKAQSASVFLPEIERRYQDITKAANDAAEAELEREAASRGVKKQDLPSNVTDAIRKAADVNIEAQKKATLEVYNQEKAFRQVSFAADSVFNAQQRINGLVLETGNTGLPIIKKTYNEIKAAANASAEAQIKSEAATRNLTVDQLKVVDPGYVKSIEDAAKAMIDAEKEAANAAYAAYNANQLRLFQNKEYVDVQKKIRDVQNDIKLSTMIEYEKIQAKIAYDAQETANAQIAAEEARRGEKLSAAEVSAYYEAAKQGTAELAAEQEKAYDNTRSFSTGWKQAMNDYVTNATDGSAQAKSIFSKTFKGIEDIIVNFAKTGKFKWKEFVASLVEELMRAQIARLLSSMMGSTNVGGNSGGGGSILGSIGSLFGGGSSNNTNSNNNSGGGIGSFLGSLGSGLLKGVTGLGGILGSVASGIGGGVSSLFGGIGKLFGGLFADGGTLPAGKWGIVGEAGPEVISGPANIAPIGKMNLGQPVNTTNVTYNINAVDAMSFKTLLAQDPSYIYALSMQGARSIPKGR